jgi:hypothetical protein
MGLFDWLGTNDPAWELGSTLSRTASFNILPQNTPDAINLSSEVQTHRDTQDEAAKEERTSESPMSITGSNTGSAVGQAMRNTMPELPDPYLPPEVSQLYNTPPPTPEQRPKLTVGRALRDTALSMIPIIGPALARPDIQKYKDEQAAYALRQNQAVDTWKQGRVMAGKLLQEQYENQIRNTNVQRYSNYFMQTQNMSPDDAMKHAVAYADSKAMPTDRTDKRDIVDITLKDGTMMVGVQDAQGNLYVGSPNGGVMPMPISKVAKALKQGTASQAVQPSAQEKQWQAERNQKWAYYNQNQLHAPQGYQPNDLDYANAERYWNENKPTSGTDSLADRWIAERVKRGSSVEQAIRDYKALTPVNNQLVVTDKGIVPVNPRTLKVGDTLQNPSSGENLTKTPTAVKEKIDSMEKALQNLSDLRFYANRHKNAIGAIQGHKAAAGRWIGASDPEVNEMFRIADTTADDLLRLKSGAQINEKEYDRLRSLVPNPRWGEGKFFSDLDGYERELKMALARRKKEWGIGDGEQNSSQSPIVQRNKKTGAVRHSLDGGKTWVAGPPSQ